MGTALALILSGALLVGSISTQSRGNPVPDWRARTIFDEARWKLTELLTPSTVDAVALDLDLDLGPAARDPGARVFLLADKSGGDHAVFVLGSTLRLLFGPGQGTPTREAEARVYAFLQIPMLSIPMSVAPRLEEKVRVIEDDFELIELPPLYESGEEELRQVAQQLDVGDDDLEIV